MREIPFIFKIIGIAGALLLCVALVYIFILTPHAVPPQGVLFVDPFPSSLQPHSTVPYPKVSISADATLVPYNGKAVLSWSAANATSCVALDGWDGAQEIAGTMSTGPLTAARTYDIKCIGEAGESTVESITVNVLPLPTGIINANPNPVPYGGNTTLTWSAFDDADECVASGGWSGVKKIAGIAKQSNLTSSRTYTMTCTGRGGSSVSSVTVSVIPRPSGELTVEPNPVPYKGSATLSWSASDAVSCTAGGSWSGKKANVGTQSTGPLMSSKTYTLKCAGAGGTISKSVTVRVLALPKGSLVAEPNVVPYNGIATLTWAGTGNATSCTASGGWEGVKSAEGTETVGPLTKTETYTLVCSGPGGESRPRAVTVRVGSPTPTKPTAEFSAESGSIPYNTSPKLTWNSEGTESCTASGGWSGVKEPSGVENPSPITRSTTYTLNCRGGGGAVSQSVKVSVIALPTTGVLRANPNPVPFGERTNVSWSASKNATSCVASGGWGGVKEISGTELVGPFETTQVLTLACSGLGGESAPQSLTVKVLPRGEFSAVATEIVSGTRPVLEWKIDNATECTASGGWSGAKTISGTETVDAITRPTLSKTYTLTCKGLGGTKTASVTVKLISLPTGTFTASPTLVAHGGEATLSWSASNDATSCAASGDWVGANEAWNGGQDPIGTKTIRNLAKTQTYFLTCYGPGGEIKKSVTIKVKPFVDLAVEINPIPLNNTPKLSWTGLNADSCIPEGWNGGVELAKTGDMAFVASYQAVAPIAVNTTYKLTCQNSAGKVSTPPLTVKIKDPTVTLKAGGQSVMSTIDENYKKIELIVPYDTAIANGLTITWFTTDAISCKGLDPWMTGTSGTYTVVPLNPTRTYKITCAGPHKTVVASVQVKVPPKVWFYVKTDNQSDNSSLVIYKWQSWYANSCTSPSGLKNGKGSNDRFYFNGSAFISGNTTDTTKGYEKPSGEYYPSENGGETGWLYYSSKASKWTDTVTLACTGDGGTTQMSLPVNWSGSPQEFQDTK